MPSVRQRVYEVIAEPPEGDRLGNFVTGSILVLIAVNVTVGILETVRSLHDQYQQFFYWFEVFSVAVFTVEYVLRLWSCTSRQQYQHPLTGRLKMACQPMSIVDFLAIAPFYLQFILPTGMDLRFIRTLRLFRLLRLFRMGSLVMAATTLRKVFIRKKEQLYIAIVVFLLVMLFSASLMYSVEGNQPDTKFTSIPQSMWWSLVTITTIGYGDMYPETPLGQFLGAVIGFVGVCVFALPVAILGAGFMEEVENTSNESADDPSDPPAPSFDEQTLDDIAERVADKVIAHLDP